MFDECKMCDVTYDIVGRLESTSRDIAFLSAAINVTSDFLHEPGYQMQAKMDAVIALPSYDAVTHDDLCHEPVGFLQSTVLD